MIRIQNISTTTRVAFSASMGRSSGRPQRFNLAPKDFVDIPRHTLHRYDDAVKQDIGEYVSHGLLQVSEIQSIHLYQDRGHNPTYALDYLIVTPGDLALTHALASANDLDVQLDGHFQSTSIHQAVTAVIAGADPTDLASLLIWIGNAQTAYTTHFNDVAAHPNVDAANALAPIAAVSLATAVAALRELQAAFVSHKTWLQGPVNVLDVRGILTY